MTNVEMRGQIDRALGAHGAWKLRLKTAIRTGRIDARPADVACDNLCEFGKWLHGPQIDQQTRSGMPYQVVRRLHAEFHRCAGQTLKEAAAGNKELAQNLLEGEFTQRSETLGRALAKWRREVA